MQKESLQKGRFAYIVDPCNQIDAFQVGQG